MPGIRDDELSTLKLLQQPASARLTHGICANPKNCLCEEGGVPPLTRYTLDSGKVNEALIALVKVDSTAGADLCDVIVRCLNGLQFDLNLLIAQCYDSASNMSGRYNGVQARLSCC